MSCNWPTVTIEEIASKASNALSTGPFGSAISSKFFTDSGVPVIRGSNLSADTGIRLKDVGIVFVSEEKAKEFSRSVARVGDLVFTCWGTINQIGYIDGTSNWDEYIISNKQMKLTVDTTKVDPRFLYYLFSSPLKQKEILSNGIGAAVPGFNLGQLRKHTFQLPPLLTQSAIADILELLDKKANENAQTNQTLEQMAQAIFKSWFVDFDPVKAKMNDEQPMGMDDATAALFPDKLVESELGLIPEGWEVKPLDKIAHFENGLALQKFRPDSEDDDFLPVLKIAHLRQGYCDGKEKARTDIKESCIVFNGDMIFSWSGSLMIDLWTGGKAALNQHLFKVTSKHYSLPLYLFWTKHHLEKLQQIAKDKAVTMGHIKRGHLSESLCVVPSKELRDVLDKTLLPLINQGLQLRLQSNQLNDLRDTLLPKLLSGEIELSQAQELAEVSP